MQRTRSETAKKTLLSRFSYILSPSLAPLLSTTAQLSHFSPPAGRSRCSTKIAPTSQRIAASGGLSPPIRGVGLSSFCSCEGLQRRRIWSHS
ncbi:hypothetical protein GUJ93_ZPchr0006g45100 [Zizania palustris]|uniref:Uncharacterized protein n=1 Tax=Zizania palustris TaxID=103762 RepID=A0A8J5SEP2_ZIZPA|nr:hypothetical protein GUJ93_ZPchr0006g45100 [Zizania palustris]